jgi:hypothetical protein
MSDDMSYLETLNEISRELRQIVDEYDLMITGMVGKANLVGLRLEQNEALSTLVAKHNRVLRFHAGLPVQPVAHSAEAVLIGTMGGSS